ncbi:bifunctional copper resistance protein CopD/cytochrome c oxidase assembly protein [Arthrobacter cavernae]|uniref:Bifunctional copper resistance protein CopD/cytochrome c oxidase assembly protein n=1 Tax=Arthrobacter cavernae TaxID=2817681 RepID=A0A939HI02_9MICC|nr:bifunctional copper resistance protein CopD/cytochrome c oxidase assembly protein [Arthrobacter cavernae]MBO1268196.1 bifunctional copper resistance protein CopD/cytochrome c oxidase assembly protein [Arthrobacter cavernae]
MPLTMRIGAVGAFLGAGLLALVWAYSYGGSAEPGILDRTGPAVTWGLPAAKLVFNLANACCIGALVLAVFALPHGGAAHAKALRIAGWSAAIWAVAAAGFVFLSFLTIANIPVSADSFGPIFVSFLTGVDAGRYGVLASALAAAVAFACFNLRSPRMVAVTTVLAFAGLVPLVLKSHATGGAGHADSTTSVILHSGSAAVWLGGLLVLILLRPAVLPGQLNGVVRRYSTLALVCFITIVASGIMAAWASIGSWGGLSTAYGGIVVAKAAALIVLGTFGALHRQWSLRRLELDPHRAGRYFTALAVAELAVMGAAVGMATALGRTEPPTSLGSAATDPGLPVPELWAYISQWAPDPLWSLACGFAVFFYLAGVRRLRRAGRTWPAHRTVLWLAGVAVLFMVTNGGIHVYQGYLFNAHVLTQMMLTAVVPLLLVPAAPLALAELTILGRTDSSTGVKEILARTVQPVLAGVTRAPYFAAYAIAGSLVAFYYTPLLGWSARGQLGYSAMTLLALLAGCLFTRAMTGRPDGGGGHARKARLGVLAGTAALYGVYGWGLTAQAAALESPWYTSVGQPWGAAGPAAAELGGIIMWVVAAGTLAVMAAIVTSRPAAAAGSRTQDEMVPDPDPDPVGTPERPRPHAG